MEEKHRDRTLLQDTDQTAQPRADKARERENSVGSEESDHGGAESNVGSKYLSLDEDGGKNQDEPELPDQARSALPQTTKSRSTGPAWGKKQRFQDGILTEEDNSGAKTALSQQEIPPPRRRRRQQLRQQLRQQHDEQPEPKKGNDNSALRLRLDLNLDIEIELKAKIHGDITLTLLN